MQNDSANQCTLYVSSTDRYADIWPYFFTLFKKYWPDCPYPIVLASETKEYSFPGLDIQCPRFFKKGQKVSWGQLTLRTLRSIETPFVLFTLEDYFIKEHVDQAYIDHGLSFMQNTPNAGRVLWRNNTKNIKNAADPSELRYELPPKKSATAYAAIWRRAFLMSTIKPSDHIWNWEVDCNIKRHKTWKEDVYKCPNYAISVPRGGAIYHGKWRPFAIKAMKENGLHADFARRGIGDSKWSVGESF